MRWVRNSHWKSEVRVENCSPMGVISHPNQPILGHCNIAEKENRDANYFERSWWHQSSTLGSDYPLLDTNIGKRTTGPQWDGVALVKTVLCQKGGTLPLTLVGTRHFAIFHGTRGRGLMPPPSRFAPNWARGLIKKPACFLSRDEAVDTRV